MLVGGSVVGMVIAAICFLIILAAIGWGVYEIYNLGHPAAEAAKQVAPVTSAPHREAGYMALHPSSKIVGWFRAGYPEGVPDDDYIPLFALGGQLTNKEVSEIARSWPRADPTKAEAIKKAIGG